MNTVRHMHSRTVGEYPQPSLCGQAELTGPPDPGKPLCAECTEETRRQYADLNGRHL